MPLPSSACGRGFTYHSLGRTGDWEHRTPLPLFAQKVPRRAEPGDRFSPTLTSWHHDRKTFSMITTLTIDEDNAVVLDRLARQRADSLKKIVNEALRRGLREMTGPAKPPRK